MLILFDCWKYTDEYYKLIESGVKTHDDEIDYSKDCYLDKILVNPELITSAIPTEEIYTTINDGSRNFLLNIKFQDFCNLVNYVPAKTMKNKWLN